MTKTQARLRQLKLISQCTLYEKIGVITREEMRLHKEKEDLVKLIRETSRATRSNESTFMEVLKKFAPEKLYEIEKEYGK